MAAGRRVVRRKGRLGWREVDARDVYLQRDRGDGSETLGVFGAGQMVWSTSYVGRSMMSPPLFWYWLNLEALGLTQNLLPAAGPIQHNGEA